MNRQDGTNLIDQVIDHDNLYMAYKHVRANKGAPGIDGITVDELYGHMQQYYSSLRRKVRDGSYQPQPVRRAENKKYDWTNSKLVNPFVFDLWVDRVTYEVLGHDRKP